MIDEGKDVDFARLERFDCDNMKNLRNILLKNDLLEKKLNEYRAFVMDMAEQGSRSSALYDFLRFMPITNMFIDIFGRENVVFTL